MPKLREKALTKINTELFLNNVFLVDGFYTNVTTGETDFYLNDISRCINVTDDPSFGIDGMTWQSPFKEWVHEDGIIPTESGLASPTVASGVTVNGTFYPKDPTHPLYNPTFAHSIDYRNGRIIFDSPISTSSVVQAAFAYKHISVEFADEFEGENRPLLIETAYKDNPAQTGVDIYPSYDSKTLPMVLIDFQGRTHEPYELGNRNQIHQFNGSFHIWTRDNFTKDIIEDAISRRAREVVLGINFNTAPFPLDEFGDKNSQFTTYSLLAQVWGPHFWRRIYFDTLDITTDTTLHNIDRSRVQFTALVYPNF